MQDNVISLVGRTWTTQKTSSTSLVQERQSALFYETMESKFRFRVYEERIEPGDTYTLDFFRVLVDSWLVKIISQSEEVDINSHLAVEEGDRVYWMGVDDFVRYTEPEEGIVGWKNIDKYILPLFRSTGIRMSPIFEDEVFTDSDMKEGDLEVFRPEDISVLWKWRHYACSIEDVNSKWKEYIVDDFTSPKDISLLYLLCHAYCGYFGKDGIVGKAEVYMNLDHCEKIYIHTTRIPSSLLKRVLTEGISRKYPIYANFLPEMSIEQFYNTKVFPLLSQDYLFSIGFDI